MARIVIASSGRAHLLDTARELQKFGHDVTFLSYSPSRNYKRYGLNKGGISLLYLMAPFIYLHRKVKRWWATKIFSIMLDFFVYCYLCFVKECDIFIAQSPHYLHSMKKAKRKFNSTILLDRGSTHIRIFDKYSMEYEGSRHSDEYVEIELEEYNFADYIVVGSNYVAESFYRENINPKKIFVNNYGVLLKNFEPTKLEPKHYDLIFVGQWSKRKGCDLLRDFIETYNEYTLIHVGSQYDKTIIPHTPNYKYIGQVPEIELVNYYKQAKVFILPSKDEGLALVQAQAISCGLPLVITHNTGGEDFYQYLDDPKWIEVIADRTIESIEKSVKRAIKLASTQNGIRTYCEGIENKISWSAYGKRYNDFLMDNIIKN